MASNRAPNKAAVAARTQILDELREDHKRVKKAYRQFTRLDAEADPEECEAIVQQVLQELQVHAALEEELLYPAAREAIAESDLVDEAEVEHESAHIFIDQLMQMTPEDEKYAARFTVLCEYVMHHVKEEEGELFPQLESARGIDWEGLAAEMTERREALMAEFAGDSGEEDSEALGGSDDATETVEAAAGAVSDAIGAIDDGPTTGTKTTPRGPDKPATAATRRTI